MPNTTRPPPMNFEARLRAVDGASAAPVASSEVAESSAIAVTRAVNRYPCPGTVTM